MGDRTVRRGLAVLAAIAALMGGAALGNQRTPPIVCSGAAIRPNAGPIGTGHLTTFSEARRAVPFPLLTHFGGIRPSIAPTKVWLDEARGIVAAAYADEDVTMFMSAGHYADLHAGLADLLPAITAKATVEKVVEGHWALLIEPDTDACGSNPAAVETELYGTRVQLYSDTRSVEELVAFGNTLLPDYAK